MRRRPINTGLPTKDEFDRVVADFAERAVVALLPGLLRNAIVESPPGRLPDNLRELLLYGPNMRSGSVPSSERAGSRGSVVNSTGNGSGVAAWRIDPTRLPTRKEFQSIAGEFAERAIPAFLPGILRRAILEIAQSPVVPANLRHLILYGRYRYLPALPLKQTDHLRLGQMGVGDQRVWNE
jgi:hypothetical protein